MSFRKAAELKELERIVEEANAVHKKLQDEVTDEAVGNVSIETNLERQLKPLGKLLGFETNEYVTPGDTKTLKSKEGKKIVTIAQLANNILGTLSVSTAPGVNRNMAQIANESLQSIQNLQAIIGLKSDEIVDAIQNGDNKLDKKLTKVAQSLSKLEYYASVGNIDRDLVGRKIDDALYDIKIDVSNAESEQASRELLYGYLTQDNIAGRALSDVEAKIVSNIVFDAIKQGKDVPTELKLKLAPDNNVMETLLQVKKDIAELSGAAPPDYNEDNIEESAVETIPTGSTTVSHSIISPKPVADIVIPFSGPGHKVLSDEEQLDIANRAKEYLSGSHAYQTKIDLRLDSAPTSSNLIGFPTEKFALDVQALENNIFRLVDLERKVSISPPGFKINDDMKIFLTRDRDALQKRVTTEKKPFLKLDAVQLAEIRKEIVSAGYNPGNNPGLKEKTLLGDMDEYRAGKGKSTIWKVGNYPVKTGEGIVMPRQRPRKPYTVNYEGQFGKLHIDPVKLSGGKLVVRKYKGGALNDEPIMVKNVDHDLISLLTKRFNPTHKYSEDSIGTFKQLVGMAGLPPAPASNKMKLLNGTAPYREQKMIKIYTDPNELMERLQVVVGSIEAGNSSPILRQELDEILNILLNKQLIDLATHKKIYSKYIQ